MGEGVPTWRDLHLRRRAAAFVGRAEQVARYTANLGLPVDDPKRSAVVGVHGPAGVGKTHLVDHLAWLARGRGHLTAYVDESCHDVPSALAAVAADLERQGVRCRDLTGRLADYRRRQSELYADPDVPEDLASLLTRSAVRLGLRTARAVPVLGEVAGAVDQDAAAGQVDRLRTFVSRRVRDHRDVRLLLSPAEVLTPVFLDALSRTARRAPVVLFLDTYEYTCQFLEPWLLDVLAGRYGPLPPNVVVTVSGQRPLDPNRWSAYLGDRMDLPLAVFTDEEAGALLAAREVTDPRIVAVITELSGNLPLLVALLAEGRPETVEQVGDPSGDAVERFLRWVSEDRCRDAALHGALPRRRATALAERIVAHLLSGSSSTTRV